MRLLVLSLMMMVGYENICLCFDAFLLTPYQPGFTQILNSGPAVTSKYHPSVIFVSESDEIHEYRGKEDFAEETTLILESQLKNSYTLSTRIDSLVNRVHHLLRQEQTETP